MQFACYHQTAFLTESKTEIPQDDHCVSKELLGESLE